MTDEVIRDAFRAARAAGYRSITLAEARGAVRVLALPFRRLTALCPRPLALAAAQPDDPSRQEVLLRGTLTVTATLSTSGDLVAAVQRDGRPLSGLAVSLQGLPNSAGVGVVRRERTDEHGEANLGPVERHVLSEGYQLLVEVPTGTPVAGEPPQD